MNLEPFHCPGYYYLLCSVKTSRKLADQTSFCDMHFQLSKFPCANSYVLLSKHCIKSLYLLFTTNHEVNNHHHVSEKTEAQRSEVSCPEAAASGCQAVI